MSLAPLLLPGEDRAFGQGLFVDLVPVSSWTDNARAVLSPGEWKALSRAVAQRAGQCEACGSKAFPQRKIYLEAHERWFFHEGRQSLRRLVALCSPCHRATHFGFAQSQGRGEAALRQLQKVRGQSRQEVIQHVQAAFALWRQRSQYRWRLDLSILERAGILTAPPSPCVQVCKLEKSVCVGCQRTSEEITAWSTLSAAEQRLVLRRIASSPR